MAPARLQAVYLRKGGALFLSDKNTAKAAVQGEGLQVPCVCMLTHCLNPYNGHTSHAFPLSHTRPGPLPCMQRSFSGWRVLANSD